MMQAPLPLIIYNLSFFIYNSILPPWTPLQKLFINTCFNRHLSSHLPIFLFFSVFSVFSVAKNKRIR